MLHYSSYLGLQTIRKWSSILESGEGFGGSRFGGESSEKEEIVKEESVKEKSISEGITISLGTSLG